jgi:ribosomal protein L40E
VNCENCGAKVPRGLTSCPQCGVFALDEPPRPKEKKSGGVAAAFPIGVLVLLVVAALWWWQRQTPKRAPAPQPALPVHVVKDRPGGNVSEAEAIRVLRRHLAQRGAKPECIAVISHGKKEGAYELTAVDSCQRTKLGTWRVERGGQAPLPVLRSRPSS